MASAQAEPAPTSEPDWADSGQPTWLDVVTTTDGTPHVIYTRSEIGGDIQTVRLSTWSGAKWIQATIVPTQALHNPRAVGASVGNLIEVAYIGPDGLLERCLVDPAQPALCGLGANGPPASDAEAPSVAVRADGFGDFTFYRHVPAERGTWYARFQDGAFVEVSQVTGCKGGQGTVGLGVGDQSMVSCLDLNGAAVNVSFYDNLMWQPEQVFANGQDVWALPAMAVHDKVPLDPGTLRHNREPPGDLAGDGRR